MHSLRKLYSTVKMCYCMFMARTFGDYIHSIGGLDLDYAVYDWRGKRWAIPTSHMNED